MPGWEPLPNIVLKEVKQREEEGCDVSGFADRIRAASDSEKALLAIYEDLCKLEVQPDFPFVEPSELEGIKAERPDGPRELDIPHSEEVMADKFLGAWLGRCAGCALGKPLETQPFMAGKPTGEPGWQFVQEWYQRADAWPIADFVPSRSRATESGLKLSEWCQPSERDHIQFMQTDDDIRYTILGLIMLESKGLNWDSYDVGKLWHRKLTYAQVCTAETQAYLNFAHETSHLKGKRPDDWEERKKRVRTHLNPYREWIGAQIRADGLAYGAAGRPELAADHAWRDASFSHIKNGIYGEMFVAAMIAAAFVESDVEKIVEIGLSEIPTRSRLAADVAKAIEIAQATTDQVELVARIWDTFKHYDCVHTNNNAALVVASLIFGKRDFTKAIATAVLGGWDTDCNGATVGSIMGTKLGAKALPEHWVRPLNDTLYADVCDFHPIKISECARRSHEVWKRLLKIC